MLVLTKSREGVQVTLAGNAPGPPLLHYRNGAPSYPGPASGPSPPSLDPAPIEVYSEKRSSYLVRTTGLDLGAGANLRPTADSRGPVGSSDYWLRARGYGPYALITRAAKLSISSSCGLNCNSNRSAPARSKAATCSLTCSAVPTRPERNPRFDTE